MSECALSIAITAIVALSIGAALATWISVVYWTRWASQVIATLANLLTQTNDALDRNTRAFERIGSMPDALNSLSLAVRQWIPRAARHDPRGRGTRELDNLEDKRDE